RGGRLAALREPLGRRAATPPGDRVAGRVEAPYKAEKEGSEGVAADDDDPIPHEPSHGSSASTASERRGQASFAQSPNWRSLSEAQAAPASGSTQRNEPDPPKWPNVRSEFCFPVQCGDLASRSSKPRPQSFGS